MELDDTQRNQPVRLPPSYVPRQAFALVGRPVRRLAPRLRIIRDVMVAMAIATLISGAVWAFIRFRLYSLIMIDSQSDPMFSMAILGNTVMTVWFSELLVTGLVTVTIAGGLLAGAFAVHRSGHSI